MFYKITKIIVFIIMIVIFCFSAQKADLSNKSSNFTTKSIVNILPGIKKLAPAKKQEVIVNIEKVIRKIAHFSIFALLGFFVLLSMQSYRYKFNDKKILLISLAFCAIYACTDEFHQIFVDGRAGRITDVLIDTTGSIFGFSILSLILLIKKRFQSKKLVPKSSPKQL